MKILVFCGLIMLSMNAYAADIGSELSFTENVEYNIYYSITDDQVGLAERVEVVGINNFFGKNFLVFSRRPGFSSKESRGFILYDSIKSLIPSDYDSFKKIIER